MGNLTLQCLCLLSELFLGVGIWMAQQASPLAVTLTASNGSLVSSFLEKRQ